MFGHTVRVYIRLQRSIWRLLFLGVNSLYTDSLACVLDSPLAFSDYSLDCFPDPSYPLLHGIVTVCQRYLYQLPQSAEIVRYSKILQILRPARYPQPRIGIVDIFSAARLCIDLRRLHRLLYSRDSLVYLHGRNGDIRLCLAPADMDVMESFARREDLLAVDQNI